MGKEITEKEHAAIMEMTPQDVRRQVNLIQQVMQEAMKPDEHYGKIPGCGEKPSLLKAGAEKLSLIFRLAPSYKIEEKELPNGHREYMIVCTVKHINTGLIHGEGVGAGSTMESKYRFRTGPVEETGKPVPRDYWDVRKSDPVKAQALIGGRGFSTKKIDNIWQIVKQGEKVENDNPADQYNTVLKMAKKRAYVDGMLTATAASDIFTQDIEEIIETELKPQKAETVKHEEVKQESADRRGTPDHNAPMQEPEPPAGYEAEPKKFYSLPQRISMAFEEIAVKTPLDKKHYRQAKIEYCIQVLGGNIKIESCNNLTTEQAELILKYITTTPNTVNNFLNTFIDKQDGAA